MQQAGFHQIVITRSFFLEVGLQKQGLLRFLNLSLMHLFQSIVNNLNQLRRIMFYSILCKHVNVQKYLIAQS